MYPICVHMHTHTHLKHMLKTFVSLVNMTFQIGVVLQSVVAHPGDCIRRAVSSRIAWAVD